MSIDYLISKYLEDGLRNEVEKDLSILMEYEDIYYIGYRVYTPTFNDGDPCEFTTLFFDKINHITPCEDYYISMDDSTNELIVTDIDDLSRYDGYQISRYKNNRWREIIEKIAPLILNTNTQGVIKRDGKGIVFLNIQSYYDDY